MLKFNFYFITTDYSTIFGKNFKLIDVMKKEFKGTKGEWKAVKFPKTEYYNERNEIHYNNDGECVAEHVANDYDALLISKAPKMLAMLIKLRDKDEFEIEDHLELTDLINEILE